MIRNDANTNIRTIEQALEERIRIENILHHLTETNIDEAKSIILQIQENKRWLQNLIRKAGETCQFNFKLIADIFALTGKAEIKFYDSLFFGPYLLRRGLITIDDFPNGYTTPNEHELKTIDEYERPIKEGTLEFFMFNDDIQNFVSFITMYDIKINAQFSLSSRNLYYESLTSFVCFCGSLNILKYLISNGYEISSSSVRNSVRSGSEEMIQFLSDREYSFDNTAILAICFFHNHIAKWLLENYKQDVSLPMCVNDMNTEMFFYLIRNLNFDINQRENISQKTSLHIAVKTNDILMIKYLLLKGINKDIKDTCHKRAFELAEAENLKDLLIENNKCILI